MSNITVSLASALLRRKELNAKVAQLATINKAELYQTKIARKNVTENVDDIIAQVPVLKPEEITAAYDWHARRLREIDLAIQQANHATKLEVDESIFSDFSTKR